MAYEKSGLSKELLDDFYAECDDHFTGLRHAMSEIEAAENKQNLGDLLEKVFRSIHTLKGIIGIVGIPPAEQLSHRTEDYLRELTHGRAECTSEGLDLLVRSIQLMEQTIAAFREDKPFPETTGVFAELNSLLENLPAREISDTTQQVSGEPPSKTLQERIQEAHRKGLSVWKCVFNPSHELNSRGINVSAIRGQLQQAGEILLAAPHIGSGGAVAFEFIVAMPEGPRDLDEWRKRGVVFLNLDRDEAHPSSTVHPGSVETPDRPATSPPSVFVAPSHIVRVELTELDEVMRITGELVIQRARLEDQINSLAARNPQLDLRGLQEVNLGLTRHFRDLRENIMRLRMVPVAEIFERMPFVVRDLTRGSAKKVKIVLKGEQTELDKYVVERLKDPLLHLVRNAVSHGIEDAEERVSKGKSMDATIVLSASTSGESVVIEVADDGCGIDFEKVAQRAEESGTGVPKVLDNNSILDLICEPGFSTKEEADRASGRGIGMSVVAKTCRELGGSLSLESNPGKGTRFMIRIPLTLLIADVLIVVVGEQNFAITQGNVDEVVLMEEASITRMERMELLSLRGRALPLLRLRTVFGFPSSTSVRSPVLVIQTDREKLGLVVDKVVGQRQVVVRSLRDPLVHVPGVVGATELGDGRPLLILDATGLSQINRSEMGSITLEKGGLKEAVYGANN